MSTDASGGVSKPMTSGLTQVISARWLGGGAAANCTRVTGTGITTVNYNSATGAYIVTLTGRFQSLEGYAFGVMSAGTTAAQKVVNIIAYSSSAGTLTLFVTDLATPTAKDLATTEEISILLWMRAEGVYT